MMAVITPGELFDYVVAAGLGVLVVMFLYGLFFGE